MDRKYAAIGICYIVEISKSGAATAASPTLHSWFGIAVNDPRPNPDPDPITLYPIALAL